MSKAIKANLTPTVIEFNHSHPFPASGDEALRSATNAAYATSVSGPDAVLLRYIAEFDYLGAVENAAFAEIKDDDERACYLAPIAARTEEISEWIWSNRPSTIEGFKALGRTIYRDGIADNGFVDAGSYLNSNLTNALLSALAA